MSTEAFLVALASVGWAMATFFWQRSRSWKRVAQVMMKDTLRLVEKLEIVVKPPLPPK